MSSAKKDNSSFKNLIENLARNLNLMDRSGKGCCGFTMPQCHTIEAIARNGKCTMKGLAVELGVAVSTMTRIINVLVRDDLVVRKSNPGDRRQVCIELTAKGKAVSKKLECCSGDYFTEILKGIEKAERGKVAKYVEKLNAAITGVREKFCK